jgi:hypothetical protein
MIKFASDLRQVSHWFSPGSLVSSTNKGKRVVKSIMVRGLSGNVKKIEIKM